MGCVSRGGGDVREAFTRLAEKRLLHSARPLMGGVIRPSGLLSLDNVVPRVVFLFLKLQYDGK